MKHLGDICKINGAEIEPVDCITGGSPCQDLSIAGKRAGLAGERSGLFMEQVRIVKEMRERDRKNGRAGDMVRPRFLVWENVPGAFSSNGGGDFQAVLEEIIHIAEPTVSVPRFEGKWTKAGAIDGDGWSVAWRTHDAQYWGVPQRRRRISVVVDFGGQSAGEILFERKSVSGHLAESGAARERLAGNAESGASYAVRIRGGCDGGGKGALVQTEKSGTLGTGNDQTIFTPTPINLMVATRCEALGRGTGFGVGEPGDPANTISAAHSHGVFATAIPINDKATRWQGGGESRNHDGSGNGLGIGKEGDPSPTLTAGDRHGVITGGNQVPLTYQMQGFGDYRAGEVASSCKQRDFKDSTDLVCAIDFRNFREGGEVNDTLQAKESGRQSLNLNNTVRKNMVVRRLTPMECERLQGFPDGWTDIGEWVDEEGRTHKQADSPRYKALGNSIALPFWHWMFCRMANHLPSGATLGSLFDGIGGFPLCWESIHGKGTARWASEIEKFPIAVTKLRFPEES